MPDYVDVQVALRITDDDHLQACWHFPDGQCAFGDDLGVGDLLRQLLQDWSRAASSRGVSPLPCSPLSGNGPSPTDNNEFWRDIAAAAAVDQGPAAIDDFMRRAGGTLYRHLCPQRVRDKWNKCFEHRSEPIRVGWDFDRCQARRLANIPFEAITCQPGDMHGITESFALARGLSLARRVPAAPGAGPDVLSDVKPPLRVLLISSCPRDLRPEEKLNVEGGAEQIQAAVGAIEGINICKGLPTFKDLCTKGPKFHVVQFDGHGEVLPGPDADAQLLLETPSGQSDWRASGDITNALLGGKTRLLVLNGCKTAAVSVFACQMPAVIGMQIPISDASATEFGRAFYAELADSGQLDMAVWKARQAIHGLREGLRWEYRTPVLYMQMQDGLLVRLRPRILTDCLPTGRQGMPFQATLNAKGGRRSFTWTAFGLPPGLHIDTSDDGSQATISGVPQPSGAFPVSVSVRSRDGLDAEKEFRLIIEGEDLRIVTEQIG